MDLLTFLSKVLDFIANIVGSVVWPGAIILIAYYGKNDIKDLLLSLKRLKFKEYELEFERKAQEVADSIEISLPPEVGPSEEKKEHLLSTGPRQAILESWIQLENSAYGAVLRVTHGLRPSTSPAYLLRELQENKILDKEQLGIFKSLRTMRNEAVHSYRFNYSFSAIENYVNSALKLSSYLDAFGGNNEDGN